VGGGGGREMANCRKRDEKKWESYLGERRTLRKETYSSGCGVHYLGLSGFRVVPIDFGQVSLANNELIHSVQSTVIQQPPQQVILGTRN
jgi:hypothetical protein